MKKLIFLLIAMFSLNFSFAQEWNGTNSTILHAENSNDALNPILVGIGTASPTNQLHTTGSVRLQGLPTSATLPPFIVGANNSGVLNRFSSDLIGGGDNNAWLLTGNTVTNNDFIGTLNAQDFRIRTTDTMRMVVAAGGNVGINSASPVMKLDMRYAMDTTYESQLVGNSAWNLDGLFVYNNQASRTEDRYSCITLGTRDSISRFLGLSKINNVSVGLNATDLTFQTEIANTDLSIGTDLRERMRITSDGTVEVNLAGNPDSASVLALHTYNNLRFENLPDGRGRRMVVDEDGFVYLEDRGVISSERAENEEVEMLKNRIEKLEAQIALLLTAQEDKRQGVIRHKPTGYHLAQNIPNPSQGDTKVEYAIDMDFRTAELLIHSINGNLIKKYSLNEDRGEVLINAGTLDNGIYTYSLLVDGNILETKKMINQSSY